MCWSEVKMGRDFRAILVGGPIRRAWVVQATVRLDGDVRQSFVATAGTDPHDPCLPVFRGTRAGLRLGVLQPLALEVFPRRRVSAVPSHAESLA